MLLSHKFTYVCLISINLSLFVFLLIWLRLLGLIFGMHRKRPKNLLNIVSLCCFHWRFKETRMFFFELRLGTFSLSSISWTPALNVELWKLTLNRSSWSWHAVAQKVLYYGLLLHIIVLHLVWWLRDTIDKWLLKLFNMTKILLNWLSWQLNLKKNHLNLLLVGFKTCANCSQRMVVISNSCYFWSFLWLSFAVFEVPFVVIIT